MTTYLGCRVGHAVSYAAYETAHIAVLYQLRHALADIIEEAHWVSQEVHRTEDLGRLADQLLHTGNAAPSPSSRRLVHTH